MTRPLQTRLRDLSEDVAPVDLTARVHRTTRRLRLRRRAVAATAAVLAVTGTLGVVQIATSSDSPGDPSSPVTPGEPRLRPKGAYFSVQVEGFPVNTLLTYDGHGDPAPTSQFPDSMTHPTLSADGSLLAMATERRELLVFSSRDKTIRHTSAKNVYIGGTSGCDTVAWVTSRRLVYATGRDIRIVNMDGTGGARFTNKVTICAPAVSPDGRTLVTVDPEPRNAIPDQYGGGERAVVMRPDGTGQRVLSLPPGKQPLQVGRFSPDGRWFDVVVKPRGTLQYDYEERLIFDARTLRQVRLPITTPVCGVAYPMDGTMMLRLCGRTPETPSTVVTLSKELAEVNRYEETDQMIGMFFVGTLLSGD